MGLKLVRKKKAKPAAPGRRKSSEIKKFLDAVDVQLRLASGDKVKKGKGFANSWMVDARITVSKRFWCREQAIVGFMLSPLLLLT